MKKIILLILAAFLALPSFSQNTIGFPSPPTSNTGTMWTQIVPLPYFYGSIKIKFEIYNSISSCHSGDNGYVYFQIGSSSFKRYITPSSDIFTETFTFSSPVTSITFNMGHFPPTPYPTCGTVYVVVTIIEVSSPWTIIPYDSISCWADYN